MHVALGAFALLVLVLAIVAWCEKRLVWPYGELQPAPQFDDPSGYGARRVDEAVQAGFLLLGWAPDLKGKRYRVDYAMLVSPDRDCLAIVATGALANMIVRGTTLLSFTEDGRAFRSTDNQAAAEIDISRAWPSHYVATRDFVRLWQRHTEWIQRQAIMALYLEAGRETETYQDLRTDHYRVMSQHGLIAYTDFAEMSWRYTPYGGLKLAVMGMVIGFIRTISCGLLLKTA